MKNPPRVFCQHCQAALAFVMDNKRSWLMKCMVCEHLALVDKIGGLVLWYQPDVVLQTIQDTSKKG